MISLSRLGAYLVMFFLSLAVVRFVPTLLNAPSNAAVLIGIVTIVVWLVWAILMIFTPVRFTKQTPEATNQETQTKEESK